MKSYMDDMFSTPNWIQRKKVLGMQFLRLNWIKRPTTQVPSTSCSLKWNMSVCIIYNEKLEKYNTSIIITKGRCKVTRNITGWTMFPVEMTKKHEKADGVISYKRYHEVGQLLHIWILFLFISLSIGACPNRCMIELYNSSKKLH